MLTPTKKASSALETTLPLTPTRRSRRISGAAPELGVAPDGGLITGGTPRKTPSTPRSRRHTSVKAADVEVALGIPGLNTTALPIVPEDEEEEATMDSVFDSPPKKRLNRAAKSSVEDEDQPGPSSSTEAPPRQTR